MATYDLLKVEFAGYDPMASVSQGSTQNLSQTSQTPDTQLRPVNGDLLLKQQALSVAPPIPVQLVDKFGSGRSNGGSSTRHRRNRRNHRRTQYTNKHKRSSKSTKHATIKHRKSYRKHNRTIKRRKSRRHR
jgi:hypothetical protein